MKSDKAVDAMSDALSLFDPSAVIGEDYDRNPVVLRDAMSFVLQLRGQGQRARNITDVVWDGIVK